MKPLILLVLAAFALHAADAPEPGKTWVLAIGISKFQHQLGTCVYAFFSCIIK